MKWRRPSIAVLLSLMICTPAKAELDSQSLPKMVIKNGSDFMILDPAGQMPEAEGIVPYGLYRNDTRFLSRWTMTLNNRAPLLLKSSLTRYGGSFDYGFKTRDTLPDMDLGITRESVIAGGVFEEISVRNFDRIAKTVTLRLKAGSDFRDMFEVRGAVRKARGQTSDPLIDGAHGNLEFSYTGLDRVTLKTKIHASAEKSLPRISKDGFEFTLEIGPQGSESIELSIEPSSSNENRTPGQVNRSARSTAAALYSDWRNQADCIKTNDPKFDAVINRCFDDLYMLRQMTPKGACVAAGLPWYAAAFGRDQAVTALQTMEIIPSIARDVIQVLAAYQGKTNDDYTEERPGKIMHELRLGEMARLREIPFVPYYGSVDSTPLWIILLHRYVETTGDLELAGRLKPHLESALSYLENTAGSGFLSYGGAGALSNQGWKDSSNSVMHKDGTLAKPPISLSEVQGYLFDAYTSGASLLRRLGEPERSEQLEDRARLLSSRFREAFLKSQAGFPALALDGDGKPLEVISSNGGHLLMTGIINDAESDAIARRLVEKDMFSGWGIRTLSQKEVAYNPMSYHNGSIWPHDNGIIVSGLCRRGHKQQAVKILEAMYDVAGAQPDFRLPELFCGFTRMKDERTIEGVGPVPYPVSCVPQAWAAGSMLSMLTSCLGMATSAADRTVRITDPVLPSPVDRLEIRHHAFGQELHLLFERASGGDGNTVNVRFQGMAPSGVTLKLMRSHEDAARKLPARKRHQ